MANASHTDEIGSIPVHVIRRILSYGKQKAESVDIRRYLEVGIKKLQAVIQELKDAGYIDRQQRKDDQGRWYTTSKLVFEDPELKHAVGQKPSNGEAQEPAEDATVGQKPSRRLPSDGNGSDGNGWTVNVQYTNNGVTNDESPTTEITNEGESNNGAHPHFEKSLSESDQDFNSLRLEIANTVGYNTKLLKGKKLKELDEISATMQAEGIKPADVRDFSTWWYATFLGHKDRQQKTPPTLDQLGEKWGAFQKSRGSRAEYIDLATGKVVEFSDDARIRLDDAQKESYRRTAGKYQPKTWAETQREKNGFLTPGQEQLKRELEEDIARMDKAKPKGSKFAGEIPEDNIVERLSKPGAFRL